MHKNLKVILACLILAMALSSSVALAVDPSQPCNPASGKICNPINSTDSLSELVGVVIEGALKIAIPLWGVAFIGCAFLLVAARGNEEKLKTAKTAIVYTAVGGAVMVGSWAIAEALTDTVRSLAYLSAI